LWGKARFKPEKKVNFITLITKLERFNWGTIISETYRRHTGYHLEMLELTPMKHMFEPVEYITG